jgi:hypothetical protein
VYDYVSSQADRVGHTRFRCYAPSLSLGHDPTIANVQFELQTVAERNLNNAAACDCDCHRLGRR